MEIVIRNESAIISGYVNAVGRESRVLRDKETPYKEIIAPGTFKRALEAGGGRPMLLNHDKTRVLAEQGSSLELREDPVGLYARATVTDPEVIDLAANGSLVGWSFGFRAVAADWDESGEIPVRTVTELDLTEVSIIDARMRPAYEATSVFTRAESTDEQEIRAMEQRGSVIDTRPKGPDPAWGKRIAALRK